MPAGLPTSWRAGKRTEPELPGLVLHPENGAQPLLQSRIVGWICFNESIDIQLEQRGVVIRVVVQYGQGFNQAPPDVVRHRA